jgi:hypothetical protein
MSDTAEALAPQSDAPVSPETAPPEGTKPETENAADPSSAAEGKPSDSPIEPEKRRLDERFAELTKHRREAEREAAFWRDRAIRQEQEQQARAAPPPPTPAQPDVEKTLADFGFDEVAHQKYEREQVVKVASEAAKRELRAEQERAEHQRQVTTYVTRAKDFTKDHPDFDESVRPLRLPEAVAKTVVHSEQGPELAYYLAKNPAFEAALRQMPESSVAYELGSLAYRLKTEREAVAKAARRSARRRRQSKRSTAPAMPEDASIHRLPTAMRFRMPSGRSGGKSSSRSANQGKGPWLITC